MIWDMDWLVWVGPLAVVVFFVLALVIELRERPR